jgi:hypothetical protein
MKKIFFSLLLVGGTIAATAQDPVVVRVNTSVNPAYTVPFFIRSDFETRFPGVTVLMWEPVDTWWRASYNNNNRIKHVYYNSAGMDYSVSLPVITGFVPEEVITKAISLHGSNIYGITRMKSANGSEVFQVRLLDAGKTKNVWMDANGVAVTDIYKTSWDAEMKPEMKKSVDQ